MPRTKKRKRYSAAFKAEAVRQVSESESPMKEIAADLGVSSSALCRWCQDAGVTHKPVERQPDLSESAEIRRLKKELHKVRQERDFLKKAAFFLCRASISKGVSKPSTMKMKALPNRQP